MNIDELQRPLYVPDLLANALNLASERPLLLLADGREISVREVRDATSRFTQALQALGVGRGTRVATLCGNRMEVLLVTNALQLLAAVAIPIPPRQSLEDHRRILHALRVEALVFEPETFGERGSELARQVPGLRAIALGASDDAQDLCKLAADFAPTKLVAAKVEGTDAARVNFSGGSTGEPKVLLGTQRSALSCLQIMLSEWEWPTAPRVLGCAPLSRLGAALFLPTLMKRGALLIEPRFDAASLMQAVERHRVNCLMLVPTMIYDLLDHPSFDESKLKSLQTVFYGASPIRPERLKEAIARIGPVFFQFYGQSEAPMTLSVMRKAEHDTDDLRRLSSCGQSVPWVHLELMQPGSSPPCPVPDGRPGEICVRGPLVMDGYLGDPQSSDAALKDGWLHTGDIAVRDPDGFLRIVDRVKNVIIRGAYNICPSEIECVLREHPAVLDCAVIGVPHPRLGEEVKAVVVLRPGMSTTPEALIAHVTGAKGGDFKAPKAVEFVAAIAKTDKGDNHYRRLRKLYGQPTPESGARTSSASSQP